MKSGKQPCRALRDIANAHKNMKPISNATNGFGIPDGINYMFTPYEDVIAHINNKKKKHDDKKRK